MIASAVYDVAILGAGLAGLSLAVRLAEERFAGLHVLVVEPRTEYRRDRTWSGWSLQPHPFQAAVAASWELWRVAVPGRSVVRSAPGLRYESIPADRLYSLALDRLRAAPHITLRQGLSARAEEDEGGVQIRFGAETARARVAFDTRPPPGLGAHGLTQLFVGWEVEAREDVFDPSTATLMDFDCVQPGAAHFTYVLPSTPRRALVEDTWFAPPGMQPPDHRGAIRDYLRVRHGLTRFDVVFEERGALPMNPAFQPAAGKRLLALGTAGGATRPSTGYAFNAIQTQCDSVAADLAAGRVPGPVRPRPGIVRLMDRVLLGMLDRQPDLAAPTFAGLFDRCEPRTLVRFLNDRASLADLLAVGLAMPIAATTLATLRLLTGRNECLRPIVAG
jgi:lycopene beta-cyclase